MHEGTRYLSDASYDYSGGEHNLIYGYNMSGHQTKPRIGFPTKRLVI